MDISSKLQVLWDMIEENDEKDNIKTILNEIIEEVDENDAIDATNHVLLIEGRDQ